MASGANPWGARLSVTPRMTIRNMKVRTTSATRHASREYAPGRIQPNRDRRVEMASRDVADGVGHRQRRQTEGQRDSQKTDSSFGEFRREHGASATSENQPESP